MGRVDEHHEILVLGAGTAGCAVAGTLAAADLQVTMVEAGPDYGAASGNAWPSQLLAPFSLPLDHDWGFTERLSDGRVLELHRGRVVGGSSATNGCAAVWGAREDYDAWSEATAGSWHAATIEPDLTTADQALGVRHPGRADLTPFQDACFQAALETGHPALADINNLDSGHGVGVQPTTTAAGIRVNAAFGFLDPVRTRANLRILPDTHVERMNIKADKVVSVDAAAPGGGLRLWCQSVVLAAGVYGSPAILLRSGIGDAPELRRIGIEPTIQLPGVGRNLHDHPTVDVSFAGTPELEADMEQWCSANSLADQPIVVKARSSCCDGPFDLHVFPVSLTPYEGRNWGWVLPVACLTPRSRGAVTLASADPAVAPQIAHGFLSDPDDMDRRRLLDGIEIVRELAASPALRGVLGDEVTPGPQEDLATWTKDSYHHYWHPVGTCAMGDDPENGGVVDAYGRLYGLDNCFAADASMFPVIPRANTNLPVAAAALRIARHVVAAVS
jgi:choline dehydrogenase